MKNQLNCGFHARRASHKKIKQTGVYNDGELVRCSMLPCQREMFDDYDKRFVIDNAPPGSGKSTTIKFVHADYLTRHRDQKLVISIPQTIISKTFQKVELKYSDGLIIYWDIDQDLCDDTPNKVNKIVQFLNTTEFAEGINQRVLICTHSALTQAYHRLKNKSAAFVNTTLTIDEAHRLLCAENNNTSVANQLGHIINHLVSSKPKGFRVWLATATFFRGDKLSILKEEVRKKFMVRYLPMDRHWEENVKYLESYTYDFVVYKHKPWKEIETLLSQDKKKTVIFCPAQNRPLADGCKYTFVANLKKHIHKVRPGARILDLVDESGREKRKKILFSDKSAKDIDIVLSVNIFDEGADWVFGEQAIDLTPSNSLRVIVQRFGRIIRDVIGKKDVNYYTFLPFVLDQLDEEEYRQTLSKHFAAFTASLLLEEYIKPVEIPKPKNKEQSDSKGAYINYFVQEVADENKRGKIINKAQQNLISLKALVDSPTLKQTQQCIIDALKDSGVKKHRDAISKQIAFMWRRRLTIDGQDISWMLGAGFDKIWKDDIYDVWLKFGSSVCGKKTFEEFRKLWQNKLDERWEENYVNLLFFVKEYQRVPQERESALGIWCNNVRQYYKNNLLSDERKDKLESINVWYWDYEDTQWQCNLNKLRKLSEKNNGNIPARIKEKALSSWSRLQKRRYLGEKKPPLSKGQCKQFAPFVSIFQTTDDAWDEKFSQFQDFCKKHSKLPNYNSQDKNTCLLASWCGEQRRYYTKGDLPKWKIQSLESFPEWYWDFESQWDIRWNELRIFVEENARLPCRKGRGEVQMRNWYRRQIYRYRANRLPPKKVVKLESISLWLWDINKDKWDTQVTKLISFVNKNGTLPNWDCSLGHWCSDQRQSYKKGKLSIQQIQQLESVLGWSWQKDFENEWNERFEELEVLVKRTHGIPSRKEKIGEWCSTQRQAYRESRLSGDRIEKLESIHEWYWSRFRIQRHTIDDLKEFVKKYKRLPVCSGDKAEKLLSRYCQNHRSKYKIHKLSNEQIIQLESIPGWYWERNFWQDKFEELRLYAAKYNKTPMTNSVLGAWCSGQRAAYKKSCLSEERIEKLESILPWNWGVADIWQARCSQVREFFQLNGHFPLQPSSLGTWCANQRAKNRGGKLLSDQIIQLESMPGWRWNLKEKYYEEWKTKLEQVAVFIAKNKRMPRWNKNNSTLESNLSRWCHSQRQRYKHGQLHQVDVHKLEKIHGWAWSSYVSKQLHQNPSLG